LKNIKRKVILILLTFVVADFIASVLVLVSDKVNLLDKFSIALLDVDFTDLYYDFNRHAAPDTNIYLVNIGNLDRLELSRLIDGVASHQPKVIGLDVIFSREADSVQAAGTDSLAASFQHFPYAVLGQGFHGETADGRDSLDDSSPRISRWVHEGLLDLNIPLGDRQFGTVREFLSKESVNGKDEVSFSFRVASLFDSSWLHRAESGTMQIKWYGTARPGNRHVFKSFDWDDVMEGKVDAGLFKGKIVLLGWLGTGLGDVPDYSSMFYTPLNDRLVGRSLPDMYGVEIHANAVKMILDDEFVYSSSWLDTVYDVLIMISFLIFLDWLRSRYPQAYPLLSKVALLAVINLLILGVVAIYFITKTQTKIFISDAVVLLLLFPDTLDFLLSNQWLSKRKWLGLHPATISAEAVMDGHEVDSPTIA
jgi:CHASE2 domain-containing sensor protein